MNSRGYVTVSILIVILFFSLLYFTFFYVGIANTSRTVSNSSETNYEVVQDSNGVERLYSLLKNNISYMGDLEYEDLERSYFLKTLSEQFEHIEVTSQPVAFYINNRTPIEVEVRSRRIDSDYSYSYNVELLHDGNDLLNGEGLGLTGNYTATIDENVIYDLETHETKYGEFELKFSNLSNVIVEPTVRFDRLLEREVSIEGQGLNRDVIIKNGDDVILKFKKGGS